MPDFTSVLLQGASLRITTNAGGPIDIDLGSATAEGPPNPVLTLLKPKVQLFREGAQIASWTPYGEPSPIQWWSVLLIALLGGLAWILLRR